MANPRIQVDIAGDAGKLKKAAKEADDALDKVDKSVEKVGKSGGKGFDQLGDKAGSLAKDRLGPLGEAADAAGIDLEGIGKSGLIAGAAVAGLGTFIAGGIQKINEMTDEVRAFRDASGIAWEDSSRLVAIMDDLGVSADTGATAMGRLAKNIDTGALEKYGIEAARAADGSIDMAGTLGNVADKMNSTVDPTKRAAMGNALFGRSWADLMPLLEQGGSGIREMADGVADYQIVTEESAAQQREMAMAVDDLQDGISGLQMSLAKELIPELVDTIGELNALLGVVHKVNDAFGGELFGTIRKVISPLEGAKFVVGDLKDRFDDLRGASDDAGPALRELAGAMAEASLEGAGAAAEARDLAQAEQNAAEASRIYAERQRDAADAAKDAADATARQRDEVEKLNATVLTIVGTQLAYDASVASLNESTDSLTQRHLELTDAVNTYGEGSAEAWEATKNYQNGIQDAKGAVDAHAQATANLAEQTAIAAGASFTAEQKTLVYRDALVKARDAATDPNLVAGLDQLIGLVDGTAGAAGRAQQNLNAAAAAASRLAAAAANAISITNGQITTSADAAERALQRRAAGGPINAGTPYIVGERGPEVVVPGASGHVLSNPQSTGGGGGGGLTIIVNSPIGRPEDVTRWISDQIRLQQRRVR